MKRWLVFVVAIGAIVCVFVGTRIVRGKRAQRDRDVVYQRTLRSYSEVLRPGMTRREVEDYLRTRSVSFLQMCCVDQKDSSKNVYDDLAKIGEEDAPWYCSEKNIYIAFEF